MTSDIYADLEHAFDLYKAALRAETPNLLEVRAYADKLLNQWQLWMHYQQYAIRVRPREPVSLKVIRNEDASSQELRGPSSPLKSSEIVALESLAKELFGDSVECSTVWH